MSFLDSGPARATSTASVVLSPAVRPLSLLPACPVLTGSSTGSSGQSKLVVLKSLATFLVYAVTTASGPRDISNESSSGNLTTPTWYFSSSFASTSAFVAFDALLRPTNGPNMSHDSQPPSTRSWVPEASGENEDFVGDFDLAATSSASWAVQDLSDIDVAVASLAENKQGSSGLDLQVASAAVSLYYSTILLYCSLPF